MLDKQDRYLKRILSAVENTEKNTAAILKEMKKNNAAKSIVNIKPLKITDKQRKDMEEWNERFYKDKE